MNAIGFNRFGSHDVLERIQVDDPTPNGNEAVVRLTYTSANMLDVLVRKGYMPSIAMPHIPGSDVVGTIESTGSDVDEFSNGDLVVSNTLFGCGSCRQCISGNDSVCSQWKVVGRNIWGSYGELVKLPASILVRPPKQLSEEELSCTPLALSTAWRSIHTLANANEGDAVVIKGASGNLGIWTTLLGKAMGLRVIALTRSEDKAKELKIIGADIVINTNEDKDPVKSIKDFTNGNGADFVLESFGSNLEQSLDMLRDGGKVILLGTVAGSSASIDVKKVYLKSKEIIGTHASSRGEFENALMFIASKNIKPIIGKRLSIGDAQKAHKLLENSDVFGKIVLKSKW
jgi:NADPH:quinone reductase-like Zn-dependent oxidoreductase